MFSSMLRACRRDRRPKVDPFEQRRATEGRRLRNPATACRTWWRTFGSGESIGLDSRRLDKALGGLGLRFDAFPPTAR